MRDVVLIPAWKRPEFLVHCLLNIKRADGAENLHYIFRFDDGHSPDLYEAIKMADFTFSHEITQTPRTKYRVAKQSFSLLSGYHVAAQKSLRLVYMIEEDVMVATDFFTWHRAIHEKHPRIFCSIAVANPNRNVREHGELEDYYRTTLDYCSLGVCFSKDMLLRHVLPEATERYYANPIGECQKRFPGCPIGAAFAEQDGLIRRTQWRLGMEHPIIYPYRARAYHAGLYGKNRGAGPPGTLQKRLEYVSGVIYSDEAMRTFAKHPEWYEDSKPINLSTPPWQQLNEKPLDLQANPARV